MAKEKILVVDDEKAINKLVCSYLTKEQFRPFPAYTGEEALDLLKKENPDLIILDIMLPEEDGLSILRRLRASPRTEHLPVMMLTARSSEYDKVIGLDASSSD